MEFEDEHDDEEHEEEEDDEEDITIPPPPSYDPVRPTAVNNKPAPHRPPRLSPSVNHTSSALERRSGVVRYRECLKNHAVNIGGHAVDGCGEFMAAGEEGTLDALKCAACNCHRNFHRKETDPTVVVGGEPNTGMNSVVHVHTPTSGGGAAAAAFPFSAGFYRAAPPSGGAAPPAGYLHVSVPHRQVAVGPTTSGGTHSGGDDMSHPSSSGGGTVVMREGGSGGGSSSKKRYRTKFSQDQKDKMLEFAEKLGWRIQKHDEAAVQQFCAENQVKRQVLKVWMHNNKHTLGKKP